MTFVWLLLFMACVALDFYITRKRLVKFGDQVELNPITKLCVKAFGTVGGLIVSHVPYVILATALAVLGWRDILAFVTGGKVALGALQLRAEQYISEAEDFFKHL